MKSCCYDIEEFYVCLLAGKLSEPALGRLCHKVYFSRAVQQNGLNLTGILSNLTLLGSFMSLVSSSDLLDAVTLSF